jgi:hypothetical protein
MERSTWGKGVKLIANLGALWSHIDATQPRESTPAELRDAEERRDLRAGKAVKDVLERVIGREDGEDPVQWQNWDWNDDRTRPVFVLSHAMKWSVVPALQAVLSGELRDFRVLLFVLDTRGSDVWGGAAVTATSVVVQSSVAKRYLGGA